MENTLKNSRAVRWAVPVGAVALVGAAIGTAPVIAAAQDDPSLPPKTAAELLVAASQAGQLSHPLSGTIVENSSLGLPSMPGDDDGGSLISLLSGSHTARIWYADPRHARLAQINPGSEVDYIRNGADTWEWSSTKNTATHGTVDEKRQQRQPMPKASLTPQQAADRALAMVGKTTTVRVDPTGRVAGRDVYELVLSPKDARSLVGQVRVALDGKTFVPLRVQVYPKGSASPAAQVGFTSVTYTRPAAANFAFKPPPGAKVVQRSGQATAAHRPGLGKQALPRKIGDDWTTVVQLNMPKDATKGGMANSLRQAMTPVPGGRVLRTKLFSVLLTDDGRLFAGAVTPDVLTQAAR
jgi:outer membrane lipoprotein-sorting protein